MKSHIENIVVGKPIVSLDVLLGDGKSNDYLDVTVFENEERFLPRVLAKYKIMSSVSEVRRNKPELVKNLDSLDFMELKIGKKRICIVVGAADDEYNLYFKKNDKWL